MISTLSKVSQELWANVCCSSSVWTIVQGLSAKGPILSAKKKHHTVQFKNDVVISGPKLSKGASQGL